MTSGRCRSIVKFARLVARTCGGIFGGAEGDTSEDAAEEPPGHRAWVGGRRDARCGGEGTAIGVQQIVKRALVRTRPRKKTLGGKNEIRLRGRRGEFETGGGEIEPEAGNLKPISSPGGKV